MKVLFVMNTPGFLRYYDETVDALLEHGHEVVLGFTDARLRADALQTLEGRARQPRLAGQMPARSDRWMRVATPVRELVDFVRYLDPRFARAQWLRDRRRLKLLDSPLLARHFGERDTLPAPAVRTLLSLLLACERAIPSSREIEDVLRREAPDVLLVSPLVNGASPQTDYVKSARALGIPSGVCVASWDNLTNKGLVRVLPDRLFVWNDAQRREAVELHRVPPKRVVVTGAQPFDRWFGRRPTADREEFCRRLGLDPGRPFVLFVGSTSNITDAAAEDCFAREWAGALRDVGVVIRPHPDRRGAWTTAELAGLEGAIVWPPERPNSVTPGARGEYFDSLYHAAAIVGINTSAMVEGAVIGRPVLTVRLPQFEQSQEGTLHFDHLLPENGGPLFVAYSFEEHVRQVADVIADPALAEARNAPFVASFIRPQGVDTPSNPVLVAGIEALRSITPAPTRPSVVLRSVLRGLTWRHERRERAQGARRDLKPLRRRVARMSGVLHAAAERAPGPTARVPLALDAAVWAALGRYERRLKRGLHQDKVARKDHRIRRRETASALKRRAGVRDE
jgi:hypothetical protein